MPLPVPSIREHATRGLAEALGIEIVELTAERVVATMPVDGRTQQPYGLLHGGASVALAETVASLASIMNVDQEQFRPVGLEINANHIRAKTKEPFAEQPPRFTSGARPMCGTSRSSMSSERLVCISRCTMAIIPAKPAE
jgi:uncharacterized protein (TIGR00369 family)